jgi:hypothetical protein
MTDKPRILTSRWSNPCTHNGTDGNNRHDNDRIDGA